MLRIYDFITSKYRIILPVLWTVVLLAFYFTGTYMDRRNIIQEARINAAASFEKDIVYRRWNAEHGSVYVPVTEKNPPNPFLTVPDKNVVTENGTALTLVNPAYMIRQAHELAREAYGILGHITSLNPIRQENAPDSWEANALDSFNKGGKEIYSEEVIYDKPYLRFMRPLITEKTCLRCHEEQGYKEGDVRGGISISIPLEPYFSIHSEHVKFSAWMIAVIWAAGISIFFLGTNRINKLNSIKIEIEKKRREAESKVIHQNYLLEKAQELGRIGTWEFDPVNNRFHWTDENCRILGVPEGSVADYEAFIGKVHPDDREYVYQEWKSALEGKPFNIVHRLLIDGQVKWIRERADIEFDEEGKAIRAIGFTQDITVPKQIEDTLKESEERHREFVEGTSDLIVRMDSDFRLTYVNNVSKEVFGLSHKDCIGKSSFDFIHPDDRRHTRNWIENITASKKNYGAIENRQVSERGRVRCMSWNYSFHYDNHGNLTGVNGIARDITIQKQMETRMLEAKKMEGISKLAGGLARDFNNILSPVMLHAEIAMDDLAPDSPLQHSMKEIYKAGKQARGLVREISLFAGNGPEEKILMKASLIVKDAVKDLCTEKPADIEIRFNNKADQDKVLADPEQLKRVIMNLCTNAIHIMREKGGLLEVTLDNEDISVEMVNSMLNLNPGRYLKISVRDTGPGMTQDNLNRIFEPYYTAGPPGERSGLGLAVINGIVQSYGGNIIAESGIKSGTAFLVYLPLSDVENNEEDEIKKQVSRGTEQILYVGDDSSTNAMEMMFERLGYKVTALSNSTDAFATFHNNPDIFDVVIIDMVMPDISGKDLVGRLKTVRQDIPVILCIEFKGQVDEVIARNTGIDALVIKPIIRDEIEETVRKVLNRNKYE